MPEAFPQAFLPYGRPQLDADDEAAVMLALKSEFLTTGPLVEAFEADLAQVVGAPHVVVCANGTAALHLSLLALGIGPGDQVIVPSITFVATANCAAYVGADVVFADVDAQTGLMTPETLAEALGRSEPGKVKAILPVHLAGRGCDMPALAALAAECGAALVEDASHAIGSHLPWGPVGGCQESSLATFSFHPVKTLTTAEGGAVTTRDAHLARQLQRLRNHGLERDGSRFTEPSLSFDDGGPAPWAYELQQLGFNYRLPDVLCALGRSQLAKLPEFVARRETLAALYRQRLGPFAPLIRPVTARADERPGLHLMQVLIDFEALGVSRGAVMRGLKAHGVGVQVHYMPVHRQPYWAVRSATPALPGAEAFYRRTLSLPLYPGLKDEDVDRVVSALASVTGVAA